MSALIYGLCALTALGCAFLLLRGYRRSRYRLLLWSGLCFAGLTVNNLLLVIDKVALPDGDLSVARTLVALGSMIILLFGLIWDSDS
jgi:hydrogenase/urease accessory protein HupE